MLLLLLLQLHRVLIVLKPGCVGCVGGGGAVPVAVVGDLLDTVAPRHVAVQRGLVFDLRSASRAEDPTAAIVAGDLGLVLRHVEVELLRRRELLTATGAEQSDSVALLLLLMILLLLLLPLWLLREVNETAIVPEGVEVC